MKRCGLIAFAAAAAVAFVGAPALAKGPLVPIPGHVVISGPGLSSPIVLRGKVYWFENTPSEPERAPNQITLVARQLGFLDAGPDVGWYELPRDPRTLGPGYAIQYTLDASNLDGATGFGPSVPLKATLYPYAPERPLVAMWQEAAGVRPHTIGQWWSAPPELRTWLVSRGLPAEPVAVAISSRGGSRVF